MGTIFLDLYGFWQPPKEILEIIKDPRFMRLYDIAQNGPARYLYKWHPNRNRGNHSLGVAYIISTLGGKKEETLGGMGHDLGHFPFAHAIDNELSKKDHDTHEREDILEKILSGWKVNGYDLLEIAMKIKKGEYKILENEIPKVCADRLEYALRDGYYLGYISQKDIEDIIADIEFNGEEITFSEENAIKFFELYFKLNYNHYMDEREAAAHAIYGKIISQELKKGKLTIDDLLKMTDTQLNQYLLKFYPRLEKIDKITVIEGDKYELIPKYRIVDPLTHEGKRVSEFYPEFEKRKKILQEKAKPRRVDIIL